MGLTVVDAGIIIGVLDAADAHHQAAVQLLSTVIGEGDPHHGPALAEASGQGGCRALRRETASDEPR